MDRPSRIVAPLALLASAVTASRGQSPEVDGEWSQPFDLPLIAIHAATLPTGRVVLFSAEHGVPGIHGWVLDPLTLDLTNVPPPDRWNPDCAGHSFLADGRLLVAGGTLQAILLPDARVLAAGGDFEASGEIYSPAYLYRGVRPQIQATPPAVPYGSSFDMTFDSATVSNSIALVRLSSVTHSNNMGQRYVALDAAVAPGTVSVPTPDNANVAPPGYYMLFVVDATGVPSASRMIRIGGPAADVDADGSVGVEDLVSIIIAWGPCQPPPLPCPADVDGDGTVGVADLVLVILGWS